MQVTTLSFENLHNHGELFANLFRARKQSFIVRNNWDLPEALGMEYDQYDTPASRWVAVHEFGEIYAGIRLTPTTARCGIYSYMIRDAQMGLLESIPQDLLYAPAPVVAQVSIKDIASTEKRRSVWANQLRASSLKSSTPGMSSRRE